MRSMAIIACKLQKFSAHEHTLKLKSMLNVSSKKNWKQILQQLNDIESLSLPMGKHKSFEQQNHQQSLSPEDKDQIITNKADAEK